MNEGLKVSSVKPQNMFKSKQKCKLITENSLGDLLIFSFGDFPSLCLPEIKLFD